VEEKSSPQASRRIKFDDATKSTNKSEARKREKKERKEKKLRKESKRRKVEESLKKSKKGSSPEVTGYEELEIKTSEKKKSKKHSSGKGSNKESDTNESKRSDSTCNQNTDKSGNETDAMETDNGEVENTADKNEEPQDNSKQSPVARQQSRSHKKTTPSKRKTPTPDKNQQSLESFVRNAGDKQEQPRYSTPEAKSMVKIINSRECQYAIRSLRANLTNDISQDDLVNYTDFQQTQILQTTISIKATAKNIARMKQQN
jgi:hypothetical protein